MTILQESKVLTLRVKMSGAAFIDDDDPTGEVIRIVTEAMDRLRNIGVEHHAGELFTLFDYNGNECGTIRLGR